MGSCQPESLRRLDGKNWSQFVSEVGRTRALDVYLASSPDAHDGLLAEGVGRSSICLCSPHPLVVGDVDILS